MITFSPMSSLACRGGGGLWGLKPPHVRTPKKKRRKNGLDDSKDQCLYNRPTSIHRAGLQRPSFWPMGHVYLKFWKYVKINSSPNRCAVSVLVAKNKNKSMPLYLNMGPCGPHPSTNGTCLPLCTLRKVYPTLVKEGTPNINVLPNVV